MIARLLRRKLYAWCNAYRKRVNAKVMNYDLRDLDNEMIEWLEFSATEKMNGSVHGCQVY